MADQNQNTIPGTLRTLKTDLELNNANPQDRLQQAGNFVQARPDVGSPVVPPANNTNKSNLSPLDVTDTKKDIPEVTIEKPQQPNYSWSNIEPTPSANSLGAELKKDIVTPNPVTTKPDMKSGFSALDETVDLPLNDSPQVKPNISKPVSPTNTPNFAGIDDSNVTISSKSSSKGIMKGLMVVVLLGLIGGGVYYYISRSNPFTLPQADNPSKPTEPTNPDATPDAAKALFVQIPKKDIAFNDSEPIRKTIITSLNTEKTVFVELNLIKDNKKVSLVDISTVFGLTIYPIITDNIVDYWLYGYNQEGIYKLTAVMQLKSSQDTKTLVDAWSTLIPRDLSAFSLNSASRIVTRPEIKMSTVTNTSGKIFNNYYYNYTSPTDSTDVSSVENYIVIASSQSSMKYVLDQIK